MESLQLNKKVLIAIIVVLAVSITGTVILYAFLASNTSPRGTLVFQSDVAGVTVTILCPGETLKTGVTGDNRQLTFTNLPSGNYQGIATKDGYSPSQIMGISLASSGSTTVPLNMVTISSVEPVYASTNPNAIIIKQGNSGTIAVTVTSLHDYVGLVSLNCYGLPSGLIVSFDPADVTLTAGGVGSLILTLTVSSTAAKGVYPISWGVVSGQHEGTGLGFLLQVS